jgi:hypothetical protein
MQIFLYLTLTTVSITYSFSLFGLFTHLFICAYVVWAISSPSPILYRQKMLVGLG